MKKRGCAKIGTPIYPATSTAGAANFLLRRGANPFTLSSLSGLTGVHKRRVSFAPARAFRALNAGLKFAAETLQKAG
jgi:hypothetical protein